MHNNSGFTPSGEQSPDHARKTGASSPGESIVRFDAVGMRYAKAPEVLSNLTFELPAGSFHFLTGATGAGKTSLLSLIYMAHRPSSGAIRLFDRDVSSMRREDLAPIRRRIGVVFQDMRLLDHLNAFDNVALPLRLAGQPPSSWHDDVSELLTFMGLAECGHLPPASLSGGERQRLAIARAVVGRPDIILADEPTGNVDPAMSQRIMRLLVQLNRQGTTVLVASHDPVLVAGSGMPVLHLENGRLVSLPRGVA